LNWRRLFDRSSLTWLASVGFATGFLVLALAYLGIHTLMTHRFSTHLVYSSMGGQANDIAQGLRFDEHGQASVVLEGIDDHGYDAFFANLKYRVLNLQGQVVASSDPVGVSLLPELAPLAQDGHVDMHTLDGVRSYVGAWRMQVQGQDLIIQVSRSDRFAELALLAVSHAISEAVATLALASLLIAIGVWVVAIRQIVQPIRRVSEQAAQLDVHRLSSRLSEAEVPTEIRPLLSAFNATLDRLELAFNEQQRFIADAAHELKTPLALVKAEMAAHPDLQNNHRLVADVDRMARTIGQLLQLSEAGNRQSYEMAEVDLVATVQSAMDHLSYAASRQEVAVVLETSAGPVPRRADEGAVFVLVRNLVENAVGYSPPGGVVRVRLWPETLEVQDQGPGVSEADRPHLFARFWRRKGQTRTGAGLGLAICHEVCKAHGWHIACDSAPGGGALFRVSFGLASV
jgi:signal transduction histidine kinase